MDVVRNIEKQNSCRSYMVAELKEKTKEREK
jgi:hypothetical protein